MASEQTQTQQIEQAPQQLRTIVLEPHSPRTSSIATNSEDGSHENSTSSSNFTRASLPSAGQPLWTHRVSASFSAMADQIAAASQAIALIPPLPDTMYAQLQTRMDEIESTQRRLESDLTALKQQFTEMTEGPEKFQKQLDEQIAAFKLEQQRLPSRLFNATVTVSKLSIKPVPLANGKFPSQFPATRGEFEHLTKERYEALMKAYGIPVTGDLAAKREACRSFIGLP